MTAYINSYEELLQKDESFAIHGRNIQTLAIEMYKIVNNLSLDIMTLVVQLKGTNHYCSRFLCKSKNVKTVRYGTDTISSLGRKIREIIPNDLKNGTSLS